MPSKPQQWSRQQVQRLDPGKSCLWITPSCVARVEAALELPRIDDLTALPESANSLVVVGGGARLDEAKAYRMQHRPDIQLICIPSIYGSGAEVSPVVVLNRGAGKRIEMGEEYLPDVVSYWPELLDGLPDALARSAAGDVWAHAMEGLLSPLADAKLQDEIAELVRTLSRTDLTPGPHWYALSATACRMQAQSSVGLVHGMAHALEGPLRQLQPHVGWGHARLCSVLLHPVMRFNRDHGTHWQTRVSDRQLPEDEMYGMEKALFDGRAFAAVRQVLAQHWKSVLRDRCTRTNGVLVRPGHLDWFMETDWS